MPKRTCGGCSLCCKVLPIMELKKEAGQRCKYQRSFGCDLHDKMKKLSPTITVPAKPHVCQAWNCSWLSGAADTVDLRRPDRSGYVIDCKLGYLNLTLDESGEVKRYDAIQVWVDPDRPDAHKDPALRRHLEQQCEMNGYVCLVRFSQTEALALFPPKIFGRWIEQKVNQVLQQ